VQALPLGSSGTVKHGSNGAVAAKITSAYAVRRTRRSKVVVNGCTTAQPSNVTPAQTRAYDEHRPHVRVVVVRRSPCCRLASLATRHLRCATRQMGSLARRQHGFRQTGYSPTMVVLQYCAAGRLMPLYGWTGRAHCAEEILVEDYDAVGRSQKAEESIGSFVTRLRW
jgi:hypothetical protein